MASEELQGLALAPTRVEQHQYAAGSWEQALGATGWIHQFDPGGPQRCRGAALGGGSCLQLLIGAAQAGVAVPGVGLTLSARSPGCGGTRVLPFGCGI